MTTSYEELDHHQTPLGELVLRRRRMPGAGDTPVFEITLGTPHSSTWVVVDGRALHPLTEQDRVVVRRAAQRFKMIEVRGHSYYGTLRAKLGWSGALRKKTGGEG